MSCGAVGFVLRNVPEMKPGNISAREKNGRCSQRTEITSVVDAFRLIIDSSSFVR